MEGIRRAILADAPAIAAIYNHFIEHTIVTFEEDQITSEKMARRMESVLRSYDWFVLEHEGTIAGYAYASRFRERVAYRFTTESTIYLSPAFLGRALGAPLYDALLRRIFELGYRHAIGAISLPNDASVRLHEGLGFVKVAHYPRVGKKFGRWIDVAEWQLENPNFDDARTLPP